MEDDVRNDEDNQEAVDMFVETGVEYNRQVQLLKNLEFGSKEYGEAVKGVAALAKTLYEWDKSRMDAEDSQVKLNLEADKIKMEKEKAERDEIHKAKAEKREWVETAIKGTAMIAVPIIGWKIGSNNFLAGLHFEEIGTIASASVKGLVGKVIPKFF